MGIRRGGISLIVNDLLKHGLIFEGATGEAIRGRKPTFLYIDSRRRAVLAADVRASETFLMLTDLVGKPLGGVVSFPTARATPAGTIREARQGPACRTPEIDAYDGSASLCLAWWTPTMRVLHAPTLGWRNVDLREPLAAATGLPVQIENSGRALRVGPGRAHREAASGDLVFISVSDGIGVGVIIHGEVLRGRHNIAGEFGHVPLSLDGPRCSCGANGCWEA
jgi:predicted NBD/HSP70 family sugar kinase